MRLAVSLGSAAFFAAKANWRFALMGMGYFVQPLHKVISCHPTFCEPSGDGSEKIPQLPIYSEVNNMKKNNTDYLSVDEIKQIIGSDSDMKERIDSLPYNLLISDIVQFLGLCESTVYKITRSSGFPRIKVGITKFIVPRPLFLDWYFSNCFYQK